MPPAVEELNLKGLGIDLKGGSFLVLEITDGSSVSVQDTVVKRNGQVVSCAELKMKVPALFQSSENRAPIFDGECQLSRETEGR